MESSLLHVAKPRLWKPPQISIVQDTTRTQVIASFGRMPLAFEQKHIPWLDGISVSADAPVSR